MSESRPEGEHQTASELEEKHFLWLKRHEGLIWAIIRKRPVWAIYHGNNEDLIEDLVRDAFTFMVPFVPGYDSKLSNPGTFIGVLLRRFLSSLSRGQAPAHEFFLGARGRGARIQQFVNNHADEVLAALAEQPGSTVLVRWKIKTGRRAGCIEEVSFRRAALEEALQVRAATWSAAKGMLSSPFDLTEEGARPLQDILPSVGPSPEEGAMQREREAVLARVAVTAGAFFGEARPTRRAVFERRVLPALLGVEELPSRSDLAAALEVTPEGVRQQEIKVIRTLTDFLAKQGVYRLSDL